ncbi:MAG: hypothetical protein JXR88_04265 [Clostridia bacterium]|nr:hypothetical protein [Clostridia bacterium]
MDSTYEIILINTIFTSYAGEDGRIIEKVDQLSLHHKLLSLGEIHSKYVVSCGACELLEINYFYKGEIKK